MTNTNAMRQGGAATGASPELSPLAQQIKDAQDAQREAAEAIAREQAARDAAAGVAGAQGVGIPPGEAAVSIAGDEGVIVIRDKNTGEEVVIQRDAIPPWLQDGPPPGVFMIPIALFASIAFVIVGLPIARAFGRRMDARNAMPAAVAPSAELRQLQTSIDTMAIEIERMSEHQRFLTRVLSERTGETLAAPRDSARLTSQ